MTIVGILELLGATVGVIAVTHVFLHGFRRLDAESFLKAAAWAPGIVVAILSIGFFAVAYFADNGPGAKGTAISCAAVAFLLFGLRAIIGRISSSDAGNRPMPSQRPIRGGAAALVVAALTAGIAFHAASIERPLGEWDAHAIWNTRARTLVRGDGEWSRVFKSFELGHADYPLLLPASIAAVWKFRGDEDHSVPRDLSILALFAVLTAAFQGARRFGFGIAGSVAVLVLASTAEVVLVAQSQTADVFVAYFFLLAYLAWLDFSDGDTAALFRVGLATGLLTWTKNEGIAWAILLTTTGFGLAAVRAAMGRKRTSSDGIAPNDVAVADRRSSAFGRAPRAVLLFALGAMLPLAALGAFKWSWAPSNDLVRDGESTWRSALADPERRRAAIKGLSDELSPFAMRPIHVASGAHVAGSEALFGRRRWGFIWPTIAAVLIALVLCAIIRRWRGRSKAAINPAADAIPGPSARHGLFFAVVFSGAFAVVLLIYTVTPRTQLWHIDTSMHRIILQFYPALVVALAHFLRADVDIPPSTSPSPADTQQST